MTETNRPWPTCTHKPFGLMARCGRVATVFIKTTMIDPGKPHALCREHGHSMKADMSHEVLTLDEWTVLAVLDA